MSFSFAQAIGGRKTQEDRGDYLVFPRPADENNLNPEAILRQFFHNADIATEGLGGGSTATAVMIVDRDVYTANLGDSPALVVRIAADGYVTITDLLAHPVNHYHNPANVTETQRVKKAGGIVDRGGYARNKRGESGLAVTRALGDKRFRFISAIPDINQVAVGASAAGERVFVIVGSDGLTECCEAEAIAGFVKAWVEYGETRPALASYILKALETGSDNVTCLTYEMPAHDLTQREQAAACLLVCDGHGGEAVAETALTTFKETFPNIAQRTDFSFPPPIPEGAVLQGNHAPLAASMVAGVLTGIGVHFAGAALYITNPVAIAVLWISGASLAGVYLPKKRNGTKSKCRQEVFLKGLAYGLAGLIGYGLAWGAASIVATSQLPPQHRIQTNIDALKAPAMPLRNPQKLPTRQHSTIL